MLMIRNVVGKFSFSSLGRDARWRLAQQLPAVSVPLSVSLVALIVLGTIRNLGFMVATGILVGTVPDAISEGLDSSAGTRLLMALATVVTLFVIGQVSDPLQSLVRETLGRRLEGHLRAKIIAASVGTSPSIGVGHLEDPRLQDLIARARGAALGQHTPAMALNGLVYMTASRLELIGVVVMIAIYFHWWLGVGLLGILLTARTLVRRPLFSLFQTVMETTPDLRRSDYYGDLALSPGAAKETRVFGLGDWIVDRFRGHWLEGMERLWAARRSGTQAVAPWVVAIVFLSVLTSLVFAGREAASGDLSLTALAIVGQSVLAMIGILFSFEPRERWLDEGSLAVPAVAEFEQEARSFRLSSSGRDPGPSADADIHFTNVSFNYPGTDPRILDELDLTIPFGRSLAIVGANGAGKTTLIKLLCRLYDPTDGHISLGEADLRDLDPVAWRRRIAVIFQDFVRYELSAADNVAFGAVEQCRDRALLERSARQAGAEDLISRLPHGWDTVLSRQYRNGSDLSGGEWQRIAIARGICALEAGSNLLVLDEPTAHLDVRAEAEFFDRFLELTMDVTTILISHRFSTVRRAESICVLDGGRVVEQGSHAELMSLDGHYARMYSIQAERFMEEPSEGGNRDG